MLWLFSSHASKGMCIVRMVLAMVMYAHGAQKLLGWFGGQGFTGTIGFVTTSMGLPWIMALLVIIGESIGRLSLLAGFLTRFVAATYLLSMLGGMAVVHWPHGYFIN